eukprot:985164-Pelagomonas_calceolata.AAC.6
MAVVKGVLDLTGAFSPKQVDQLAHCKPTSHFEPIRDKYAMQMQEKVQRCTTLHHSSLHTTTRVGCCVH